MDVYEKEKVMLSVLSLTQKKIDEAYALGKKEAQAEITEAWSAGHLSATTEDVELMDSMKEKHKAEIDELMNMLLYCNPVPAKKTQYEALMDKHRGR